MLPYQVGIVLFLVPVSLVNDIVLSGVFLLDLFFDLLPIGGLHVRRVDATSINGCSNLVHLEPEKGQKSEYCPTLLLKEKIDRKSEIYSFEFKEGS
jgi:hypothetical protein